MRTQRTALAFAAGILLTGQALATSAIPSAYAQRSLSGGPVLNN
jgi:hypothetical protein